MRCELSSPLMIFVKLNFHYYLAFIYEMFCHISLNLDAKRTIYVWRLFNFLSVHSMMVCSHNITLMLITLIHLLSLIRSCLMLNYLSLFLKFFSFLSTNNKSNFFCPFCFLKLLPNKFTFFSSSYFYAISTLIFFLFFISQMLNPCFFFFYR